MNAALPAYPAYKDSGVPWLGRIPAHWEFLALKRLGWFKSGTGFPIEQQGHQDLELPFFKVSDMTLRGNSRVMSSWNNSISPSTASSLGATVFPPGTIIFPKVGGAMLTNKRRIVERDCCIDNNLMGCVVKRGDQEFVMLLLQYLDFAAITKPGPVPAISEGEVREIRVVLPPLPEQHAITRYLDHIDRRIRRYIRAKQKLIALLEEQKQAVIHRAVTGQIDVRTGRPYPAYKPSGVEWLGDVPEHWDTRPAKYRFREVDERSLTGDEELLSVSHITGVTLRSQKNITMFMAASYVGHKRCQPGDLVINTMWAWMGALGIAKQTGLVSPSYGVYRPLHNSTLLPEYADRLLRIRPYVDEYIGRSTGIRSSRLRLYPEQFLRIHIVCPSVNEQRSILDHIADETNSLNLAIERTQREIALLREYRTRLIADVVTGQVDVRAAAAQLPAEAEEFDALDEAEAELVEDEEGESQVMAG